MIAPETRDQAARMGLSPADWQEAIDFRRFLAVAAIGPSKLAINNLMRHDRAYAWLWYALGQCGAPPLMWEGDDN